MVLDCKVEKMGFVTKPVSPPSYPHVSRDNSSFLTSRGYALGSQVHCKSPHPDHDDGSLFRTHRQGGLKGVSETPLAILSSVGVLHEIGTPLDSYKRATRRTLASIYNVGKTVLSEPPAFTGDSSCWRYRASPTHPHSTGAQLR